MSGILFWIIDEEWKDYELEKQLLSQRYPGCTIKHSTYEYEKDLEEFGKDADVILAQVYSDIPKNVIERLNRCRAIALYGGGYDRVDVVAAKEKGIKVTNVSGYCKEDLADYVMAAIYYFYKQLHFLTSNVKQLPWGADAVPNPPNRISTSKLCILGFGRIGQCIAEKAKANGMHVLAYDPHASAEKMKELSVEKVEWEQAFRESDYISVNMILTPETEAIIGYKELSWMKPTAYLINSARGKIFNEADLVRAAKEKLFAGAMLDVIAKEPPTFQEEIFAVENIHITSHISYVSNQSLYELIRRTVSNAVMGYEGEISGDLVNP